MDGNNYSAPKPPKKEKATKLRVEEAQKKTGWGRI
jgi:hypothetical protein